MTWTNVLVPVLGGDPDADALLAAKAVAAPFEATITAVYGFATAAGLFNWVNETGAGVTDSAIRELERISSADETYVRDMLALLDYPLKAFESVAADDWQGLRTASRLADVVVWSRAAARGQGSFAGAFQEILMDERRPALIADAPPAAGGLVVIAWDGGREASRAARRALPWLQQADEVVVVTAPQAMTRPCGPHRILSYLADHDVPAAPMALHSRGEAGPLIQEAVRHLGATMLVAGAFGHPRLQRFIFGGTTRALLDAPPAPALFLSH